MASNHSSGSAQAQACDGGSILQDHPNHTRVLTSPCEWTSAQFCGAFCHVIEVKVNFKKVTITEEECLDKKECIIGKDRRENSQPRYVMAFGVLKKGKDILYSATYDNCCENEIENLIENDTKNKITHAEEFFKYDAEKGELHKILDGLKRKPDADLSSQMAKVSIGPLQMNMYITLQPCHCSAKNTPEKSCTETLIALYKDIFKQLDIQFVVKPTFIYKAYWKIKNVNDKQKVVKKAKAVQIQLQRKGIKIQTMKNKDWYTLTEMCTSTVIRSAVNQANERKTPDYFIVDVEAHWDREKREIENAKEGLRQLQEAGIDIQKMKKEDWIFLKDHLCPSANICCDEKPYEGSHRKKMDDFIQTVINQNMASGGGETGARGGEGPESSDRGTRDPESSDRGTRDPEASDIGPSAPESSDRGTRDPESSGRGTRDPEASGRSPRAPESSDRGTRDPEASDRGQRTPESSDRGTRDPEASDRGPRAPESSGRSPRAPESSGRSPRDPEASDRGQRAPESSDRSPRAPESSDRGKDLKSSKKEQSKSKKGKKSK